MAQIVDQSSYSEFVISSKESRTKKNVNKLDSQREGRWTSEENLKYLVFLSHNLPKFQCKKKRMYRLYKPLSKFVQTRNSEQCRSHHRKLIQRFKTPKNIVLNLELQFDKTQIQALKKEKYSKLSELQIPQKKNYASTKPQSINNRIEQIKPNLNIELRPVQKCGQTDQERRQIKSQKCEKNQHSKSNFNICIPEPLPIINYQALNWINNLYLPNYSFLLSGQNVSPFNISNNAWMNYNRNF